MSIIVDIILHAFIVNPFKRKRKERKKTRSMRSYEIGKNDFFFLKEGRKGRIDDDDDDDDT
jgi:hypothetical protein